MRKIEMAFAIAGTEDKNNAEVKRLMKWKHAELEAQYNELMNTTEKENTMNNQTDFTFNRLPELQEKHTAQTTWEEKNVTSTNLETTEARTATTEAVKLFQTLAKQFDWKLWIPRKCDGIVAKENKDRVLELYWTAEGFDLYMRNDLFEDIASLVEEHTIPVVHKFRKGWNMQNRYSVTEANAIAFLDMLATL